ncbi:2-iminobutanoate/2-iminopropanoate deaminase [Hathewaya proteolytica DSM 3090]|uniref:2-iminobutanoate/2-iminopropanoate deaminase n=1 Tax=Hathewaya proteolytica DSM 3090 TaxID=1121331 RepID=A0A1M6JIR9_9CLOT|nr:RidA family protein [Hathewaya proteolytica]SHJ46597.1 2-iminobutanoate/2-iminopropanoate deaminase [Hathewaya proteolytica DSM 3090]
MKEIISTELAPGAIGPYSQGIKAGSIIFTSGQLPVNPATGELETKDIRRATELSMKNVEAILKAKGASLNNVVKTTIFLKDISMFGDVNEVYGTFFKEEAPARSCVQVAKLPKDALIEIEAIAYL